MGAYAYLPQEWSYGVRKFDMFQILYCTEIGKCIHLRAQHCQNYGLYLKIIQVKVLEN